MCAFVKLIFWSLFGAALTTHNPNKDQHSHDISQIGENEGEEKGSDLTQTHHVFHLPHIERLFMHWYFLLYFSITHSALTQYSPPPLHWLPGKLLGQWGIERRKQALVSSTCEERGIEDLNLTEVKKKKKKIQIAHKNWYLNIYSFSCPHDNYGEENICWLIDIWFW